MSMILSCNTCGDTVGAIGAESKLAGLGLSGKFTGLTDVLCPGKGKHRASVKYTRKILFGFVQMVAMEYPETDTVTFWKEYIGPMNVFFLRLTFALLHIREKGSGVLSLMVGGEYVWSDCNFSRSRKYMDSLYGPGLVAFNKLALSS